MSYQIDEQNWEKVGRLYMHTVCGQLSEWPWEARSHRCPNIWEDYR